MSNQIPIIEENNQEEISKVKYGFYDPINNIFYQLDCTL